MLKPEAKHQCKQNKTDSPNIPKEIKGMEDKRLTEWRLQGKLGRSLGSYLKRTASLLTNFDISQSPCFLFLSSLRFWSPFTVVTYLVSRNYIILPYFPQRFAIGFFWLLLTFPFGFVSAQVELEVTISNWQLKWLFDVSSLEKK